MEIKKIIESLSPLEKKVLPFLKIDIGKIVKKSGLDKVSVLRALRFLENKSLVKIKETRKTIIGLGVNGLYYKKNGLPERVLLGVLERAHILKIDEAARLSKLSENEFKAALGALKKKLIIKILNGKISLSAAKEEIVKKFPEELLIEALPKEKNTLQKEELFALNSLINRKKIIETKEETIIEFSITELGESMLAHTAQEPKKDSLIEELTPEMIKSSKNLKFRRYDIHAPVPRIHGGKKHFVSTSIEKARKIWLGLGFKEMKGPLIDTSFWIFDSLFTAQDHSAREMQDSFFIKGFEGELPDRHLVERVKNAHEKGVAGSKGWQYSWSEEEAKKILLRTHTTSLSAKTLSTLKKEDMPAKFFAIGKVFRNETIDWSHGIEFYQTEGIVVGKNLNLQNLIGYLKEFYAKMGFEKIRFRPSFFPYTEPSLEIDVFHKEKNLWLELGGAGIFRPEVTMPLLNSDEPVPVLAWGLGLDRIIMSRHKIKDLRELYANDITILRGKL